MRLLTAAAIVAVVLGMLASGGAYGELHSHFAATVPFSGVAAATRTLTVVGPQRRGADSYRGVLMVSLGAGGIEIQGRGALKVAYGRVLIPRDSVRFCAKTCFGAGNWSADVVLEAPAMELSFEHSSDVIDWCWRERVPVLPQKSESAWLYEGGRLPDPQTFTEQFSTRDAFDAAVRNSCLGI